MPLVGAKLPRYVSASRISVNHILYPEGCQHNFMLQAHFPFLRVRIYYTAAAAAAFSHTFICSDVHLTHGQTLNPITMVPEWM